MRLIDKLAVGGVLVALGFTSQALGFTIELDENYPVSIEVDGEAYAAAVNGTVTVDITYEPGSGFVIYGDVDIEDGTADLGDDGSLENLRVDAQYEVTMDDLDSDSAEIEADGTASATYISPAGVGQEATATVKISVVFSDGFQEIESVDIETLDVSTTPSGGGEELGVIEITDATRVRDTAVELFYSVEPPESEELVDVYLAVLTPGVEFLFVDNSLTTTEDEVPLSRYTPIEAHSGSLLLSLGTIEEGPYTFFAVFAKPGAGPYDSADWLSNLETESFEF